MNQKESILIIDDDESTCRSLRLIFAKKGYETEIAGTAKEALEKIKKRSLLHRIFLGNYLSIIAIN